MLSLHWSKKIKYLLESPHFDQWFLCTLSKVISLKEKQTWLKNKISTFQKMPENEDGWRMEFNRALRRWFYSNSTWIHDQRIRGFRCFHENMKTCLLIKLNPSFTLKTLTGAAPRDGREQSHWQEVFRRIDTIYHTSNIALSSIIMSNIRFENFCSSCRTCPLNFRPVDPQNKSDLCCENRKNSTRFLSSF